MPSSSISDPCSIERTPARTARLIPSAPWACAATNVPYSAACSTAARICSSVYSETPGLVPRVSTAPVAMILMKSAPPFEQRPHPLAHLVGRVGDAEPVGQRQA